MLQLSLSVWLASLVSLSLSSLFKTCVVAQLGTVWALRQQFSSVQFSSVSLSSFESVRLQSCLECSSVQDVRLQSELTRDDWEWENKTLMGRCS